MMVIRNETAGDYTAVETLTRRAFYNIYIPGCVEHYLVHCMRGHADFLPELDFVLELDGQVIGNIMYTKAKLVGESGMEKDILTLGPLSIAPEYQRKGYGTRLMEHSFVRAAALGYDGIVIFGSPANYVGRGFQSCRRFQIATEDGRFPAAMLVKELVPHALGGERWVYYGSPAMEVDEKAAARYDDSLEPMEKRRLPSQEEFYIISRSFLA